MARQITVIPIADNDGIPGLNLRSRFRQVDRIVIRDGTPDYRGYRLVITTAFRIRVEGETQQVGQIPIATVPRII